MQVGCPYVDCLAVAFKISLFDADSTSDVRFQPSDQPASVICLISMHGLHVLQTVRYHLPYLLYCKEPLRPQLLTLYR